jgi:hypothetical protein
MILVAFLKLSWYQNQNLRSARHFGSGSLRDDKNAGFGEAKIEIWCWHFPASDLGQMTQALSFLLF